MEYYNSETNAKFTDCIAINVEFYSSTFVNQTMTPNSEYHWIYMFVKEKNSD